MEIFKVPVRGSYGYCGWSVLVVLNISNNSDRSLQKGGLFLSRLGNGDGKNQRQDKERRLKIRKRGQME